jgi:peroxiredoxin (alkyl hydroperoxide reductase subunit C)
MSHYLIHLTQLENSPFTNTGYIKEDLKMPEARVGKIAPDFTSAAYIRGEGFKEVKLSDYRGNWLVLCFYPGDFTFV